MIVYSPVLIFLMRLTLICCNNGSTENGNSCERNCHRQLGRVDDKELFKVENRKWTLHTKGVVYASDNCSIYVRGGIKAKVTYRRNLSKLIDDDKIECNPGRIIFPKHYKQKRYDKMARTRFDQELLNRELLAHQVYRFGQCFTTIKRFPSTTLSSCPVFDKCSTSTPMKKCSTICLTTVPYCSSTACLPFYNPKTRCPGRDNCVSPDIHECLMKTTSCETTRIHKPATVESLTTKTCQTKTTSIHTTRTTCHDKMSVSSPSVTTPCQPTSHSLKKVPITEKTSPCPSTMLFSKLTSIPCNTTVNAYQTKSRSKPMFCEIYDPQCKSSSDGLRAQPHSIESKTKSEETTRSDDQETKTTEKATDRPQDNAVYELPSVICCPGSTVTYKTTTIACPSTTTGDCETQPTCSTKASPNRNFKPKIISNLTQFKQLSLDSDSKIIILDSDSKIILINPKNSVNLASNADSNTVIDTNSKRVLAPVSDELSDVASNKVSDRIVEYNTSSVDSSTILDLDLTTNSEPSPRKRRKH
ncbi:hypothetical protein CHUAL_005346 [Chamberlinius hualienensis]